MAEAKAVQVWVRGRTGATAPRRDGKVRKSGRIVEVKPVNTMVFTARVTVPSLIEPNRSSDSFRIRSGDTRESSDAPSSLRSEHERLSVVPRVYERSTSSVNSIAVQGLKLHWASLGGRQSTTVGGHFDTTATVARLSI